MAILQVTSHKQEETEALGKKLATSFVPGDVLLLTGPLGSGKTTFVRGLAEGRGIARELVNSPSYTFVNEYPAEVPLYHFDLYRLEGLTDLHEIGWNEYLSREGIIVVEWGEQVSALLSQRHYLLEFAIVASRSVK